VELIDNHTSGIYQIENTINGKKYIGQAVDLYERNYRELTALKGGYFTNKHLQNSWNKYGSESFELTILVDGCEESELDDLEIANILLHDATDTDYGYNKTEGGNGGRPVEETKEKISKTLAGRKRSKESILKQSKTLTGKKHSEETKKKQSSAAFKRYEDPNERLKTSEMQLGNKHFTKKMSTEEYNEWIKKQKDAKKGKPSPLKINIPFYKIQLCKIGFKKTKKETAEYLSVSVGTIDRVCKENINATWRNI
jgi:group I intron endonuclease